MLGVTAETTTVATIRGWVAGTVGTVANAGLGW